LKAGAGAAGPITEATPVNWHKKAGDAVKRDENLVDIETDKVVLELPADSGVLTEIRRGDGSKSPRRKSSRCWIPERRRRLRAALQRRRRLRPLRQPRSRRRIRPQLREMHQPQRNLPPRLARPHCRRRAR
jgi:hypothetical protein